MRHRSTSPSAAARAAPASTSSASSTTTTTSTGARSAATRRDYPGKLIIPGTEVTTYKGHYNNHRLELRSPTSAAARCTAGTSRHADARPRSQDAVAPAGQFGPIQASGGWTQINHPTTSDGSICRGCPWDYTDAETDFSKVDAIEVQNGAGRLRPPRPDVPSPFTATAIAFYERALATGAHIAAVGSSDAHKTDEAGR